jgi:hypothetical protein
MKLNEARLNLKDDFGDNYLIEHPKYGEIPIGYKNKITLNQIIDKNDDGNLIKLSRTNNPNWRKLIGYCECVFTITNDGNKIASTYKAFTIKECEPRNFEKTRISNTELENLCIT